MLKKCPYSMVNLCTLMYCSLKTLKSLSYQSRGVVDHIDRLGPGEEPVGQVLVEKP
jgi:hypothetical protein